MAQTPTEDEVVEAARSLGREEFTRDDVAEELGVEISELQPSWKAAKNAGRIQKSRNEGGKRYLRLAD